MSHKFALIAEWLEVQPLLMKVLEHEQLWAERTERQNYPGSAHKQTETIYLRWAVDESVYGGFYCLESMDHAETVVHFAPAIFDLVPRVLTTINPHWNDLGRVILTRMKPGAVITEHIDEGPYADKYDRFHVCLSGVSNFIVDGQRQIMRQGDLWWFNHKLPHRVENFDTAGDRVHLIIDLVAPAYRAMRGLTFQRERPFELLDEARPLFEAHYQEIAHYQDIPLSIDEDLYCKLEEAGVLRVFTARLNGELVGYCVFKVGPNPRYQTSIQAVQDILYIDKTKRGILYGKRLIEYSYQRLRAEGVQVAYQHCKVKDQETVGRFFELTGHELIDLVYGKRLDR